MSERLVRGADLLDPVCEGCDHVEGFHGFSGCRSGRFEGSACGCMRTHQDVHLAHVEGIVRREVAKALRAAKETERDGVTFFSREQRLYLEASAVDVLEPDYVDTFFDVSERGVES